METPHNTNHTKKTANKENKQNDIENLRKPFQKCIQEKLAVTVIVIMLVLFALVTMLYNLVNNKSEEYTKVVLSQYSFYDSRALPYRRGDITDRDGTYLATSERAYNLIIDPGQIYENGGEVHYLTPMVDALVQCFGHDRTEPLAAIEEKEDTRYLRYERKLSREKKEEFETLKKTTNNAYKEAGMEERVYEVWFEDEYKRLYSYSVLACSLVGFSGSDSGEGTGRIEQSYNSTLIGTNGREYGYLNDDSNMETVIKSASNGNTVTPTTDASIQNTAEKQIGAFQQETSSKQMGVIVMDPRNGEILTMATDKRYDLDNPRDLSGYYTQEEIEVMDINAQMGAWNQMWWSSCVSNTYEPGPSSKVLAMTAGFEDAVISTGSHFFCDGSEHMGIYDIKYTVYAKGSHGDLSLDESLIVSCNDVMMQTVALEGKTRLSKYTNTLGSGQKTGIDLPGEADVTTSVYTDRVMGPVELATNSFGQGANCTMIQLAAAFSSAINGGSYYELHVTKQTLNEQGAVVRKPDPALVREAISENTSRFIRDILWRTVEEGTGKVVQAPGYKMDGKTGTAEKIPRELKKYAVPFYGFVPVDDPEASVYVVIDDPQVEIVKVSSAFAGRVFFKIMRDILPYMNIFPDVKLSEDSEELQGETQPEGITENTNQPEDGETDDAGETEPGTKCHDTGEFAPEGGLGLDGTLVPSTESGGDNCGGTVNGLAGQDVPESTFAAPQGTGGPGPETTPVQTQAGNQI